MSNRATQILQSGQTWKFRDGQPLPDDAVTQAQNVLSSSYGVPSVLTYTGFDMSDFVPGSAVEVNVTVIPDDVDDTVSINAILFTNSATTSQVSNSGLGAVALVFPSLGTVDPTDPSFSVLLNCASPGPIEIAQVTADSAQLEPPTNTSAPVATTNFSDGTVSVTTGGWNAFPTPTFTYLWSNGQTTQTATLSPSDAGNALSCVVTATNSLGSASVTSNVIGPYFPITWIGSSAVAVQTQANAGGVQTPLYNSIIQTTGTFDNTPFPVSYSWQWYDNGTLDATQTGSNYVPSMPTQAGHVLTATITATTVMGTSVSPVSTYTLPKHFSIDGSTTPWIASDLSFTMVYTTGVWVSNLSTNDWTITAHGPITGQPCYEYGPPNVAAEWATPWIRLQSIPGMPASNQIVGVLCTVRLAYDTPDTNRQVIAKSALTNGTAPTPNPWNGTGLNSQFIIPQTTLPSATVGETFTDVATPMAGIPNGPQAANAPNFNVLTTLASAFASGGQFEYTLGMDVYYF